MTDKQDPGQPPRNDPVSSFSDPKLIRPAARGPAPTAAGPWGSVTSRWIVFIVIVALILGIVLAVVIH